MSLVNSFSKQLGNTNSLSQAVGHEVWRSRRGHVPGQPASNDSEEAAQHHVDLLDAGLHLDSPISQPTEMSYFLQRLRLAEIPRGIVDHTPMAVTSAGGASYYTHVTAIDFELDQMIHDIPSFFHLDTYKCSSDSTTSGIFIQAYLPSSVIHTQCSSTTRTPATSTTPVMSVATAQMYQRPDTLSLSGTPNPVDANRSGPLGAVPDQTPVTTGQSSYGNQLAQSLEELVDIDGFQWDDLFSGMDGSTFF
ncbi:unnamed protein product [Aspergillus oryzae]|uniref:Unnamed protein product n=1 Tax=Aspergillus oryzae TaxID=5062 RepID=A0AAN4YZU3_ASPOZ|nr:unnamed protein product [Aspergillus oryzae]